MANLPSISQRVRAAACRALASTGLALCGTAGCSRMIPVEMTVEPAFTGGFVDITGLIETRPPFAVAQSMPNNHRDEPEATVGAIADLDGDGSPEVIVGPTLRTDDPMSSVRSVQAYRYDRATGTLIDAGPLTRGLFSGAIDVDGDGRVDLLAPSVGSAVAYGLAGGTYDIPVSFEGRLSPFDMQITALAFVDIDRDGWLDALVGTGTGGSSTAVLPYIRTGARTWALRPELFPVSPSSNITGILDVEFAAGRLIVAVGQDRSQAGAPSFFRTDTVDASGFPVFEPLDPLPVMRILTEPGNPGSETLARHAPMGASAGDLDGDGLLDLDVSIDPLHEILRGTAAWPFEEKTSDLSFGTIPGDQERAQLPWGVALVDFDRDGRQDVLTVHGNDSGAFLDNSIGPQWFTAHWNAGDWKFIDVSTRVGVARRGQWRALTVGDLDNDGDVDAIAGGMGEMPRVYRNDVAGGGHGFTLRLHGTTSNHLGVGARVAVNSSTSRQVFIAGNVGSPIIVSEPLVFVGLGPDTSAQSVEIRWPSGTVQWLRDVPAGGVIEVTEPPSITLDPPTRHAPADGVSAVTVLVSPRSPNGALRTNARIELATEYGDARIDGPPEVTDAGLRFRLVAPAAAGSTLVRVSIDGSPAGVSPRVFWD